MNEILDKIRSRVGKANLSDSCRRGGCRVSMENMPSPSYRVVVDADLAFPTHQMEGKRCDYVLFFIGTTNDTLITASIELKSGSVDASEASEQLQRGADFANRFAPKDGTSSCYPVLFHGNRIHRQELKVLNRTKVHFRGLLMTITTARCGKSKNLAHALGKDVMKMLRV